MKLVAKEDIEAPIERVFEAVSDVESFQRSAIRRGATVTRTDRLTAPGAGMSWDAAFDLRGRRREMTLKLVELDAPEAMRFEGRAGGLDIRFNVDLMSLARNRTRLRLELEVKPQTLSGRLLVQSMKLARGSLTKRMNLRLAEFAAGIENAQKRRA